MAGYVSDTKSLEERKLEIPTTTSNTLELLRQRLQSSRSPYLNVPTAAAHLQSSEPLCLHSDPDLNHEYLPIAGLAKFTSASQKLILGGDSPAIREKRVTSFQTISGTGAVHLLRVTTRAARIQSSRSPVYHRPHAYSASPELMRQTPPRPYTCSTPPDLQISIPRCPYACSAPPELQSS